jgi:hypothetical protein
VTSFSTGRGISTVPPKREGATRTVQHSKLALKVCDQCVVVLSLHKVAIPLRVR